MPLSFAPLPSAVCAIILDGLVLVRTFVSLSLLLKRSVRPRRCQEEFCFFPVTRINCTYHFLSLPAVCLKIATAHQSKPYPPCKPPSHSKAVLPVISSRFCPHTTLSSNKLSRSRTMVQGDLNASYDRHSGMDS